MGFIKLDRKLFESQLWTSEPFTRAQAWVDLIAMANFADRDKFYRGSVQRVKRGQVVTSERTLANRWNWSRRKVSVYLQTLERAGMVAREGTTKWTTLTLVNYRLYQDEGATNGTTKEPRKSHKGATKEPQKGLQEESKEGKKEKIYIPTRADVASYVSEKALPGDPDEIFDYYEAVGWEINGKPIKDWKAVVRRWKSYGKPEQPASKEDEDAELHRLLEIMENGGNIYDTTGS